MEHEKILRNLRNSAKEELMFYSNVGKEARERWVVCEFLKAIKLPFEEIEVISMEQSSKTDVKFRDANFQVKEITNPNTRVGKIARDTYNSIKLAKELKDIEWPSILENTPKITKVYDLVLAESKVLSESKTYKTMTHHLDLIFYVTRTRAYLILSNEVNINDFYSLGWRSILCFNSKQATVIYAAPDAPEFLRKKVGSIVKLELTSDC